MVTPRMTKNSSMFSPRRFRDHFRDRRWLLQTMVFIPLFCLLIYFFSLLQWTSTAPPVRRYSNSTIYYSSCGVKTGHTKDDIASRLNRRIRCRLESRASVFSAFKVVNQQPAYFLTHDLMDAIGLGNFMFMAAAVIGLAEQSGRKAFLGNNVHEKSFQFNFPSIADFSSQEQTRLQSDGSRKQDIHLHAAGIFEKDLARDLNVTGALDVPILCTLHGYMQSFRYFHNQSHLVQRQFTFSSAVNQNALASLLPVALKYPKTTTVIGIHVRRGDLLNEGLKNYGHSVASDQYLLNVVGELQEKYFPALFVVVSNDLVYCRNLLERRVESIAFIEGNSAQVDMAILSLMDHVIMTVGSFGWWGAYLSDAKEVFYYRHWPVKGTLMDAEYNRTDYFPVHWTPAG